MKNLMLVFVLVSFIGYGFGSVSAFAVEVEGVNIADSVSVSGQHLVLNGAGVRSKFFFDIYIAALYLPKKEKNPKTIISSQGSKQVTMHFIYKEVGRDKLVGGWNEGFEKNTSAKALVTLQSRLNTFNTFFHDMKGGDKIIFNFSQSGDTSVTINGTLAGSVQGADFQATLLSIWLGEDPADDDLKGGMLGE